MTDGPTMPKRTARDVAELVTMALTEQAPHLVSVGSEMTDAGATFEFRCDGAIYRLEMTSE